MDDEASGIFLNGTFPSILEVYVDSNISRRILDPNCSLNVFIQERTLNGVSILKINVLCSGIVVYRVGFLLGNLDQGTNVFNSDIVVFILNVVNFEKDSFLNIEDLQKTSVKDHVEGVCFIPIDKLFYNLNGYGEKVKILSDVSIAVSNRVKGNIFLVSILKEKYNIRR